MTPTFNNQPRSVVNFVNIGTSRIKHIAGVGLVLSVLTAVAAGGAAAGSPAEAPSMPSCDPGEICSLPTPEPPPPPPGTPPPAPGTPPPAGSVEPPAFLADQYEVAYWEETASDILDSGGLVGAWGTTAVLSPSGCRTSTATRTAKALLGRVLFRHTLRAHWCWAARRVTQVGLSCLITDVDSVAIKADLCASSGYYYTWNGAATGGYHAIGSATYSNCILRYGCWRQWVVNAELWLNGNGTWTSRTT